MTTALSPVDIAGFGEHHDRCRPTSPGGIVGEPEPRNTKARHKWAGLMSGKAGERLVLAVPILPDMPP